LFTTKQLPSTVLRELQKLNADVSVLTVLPPGGLPQVKFMATELLKCCPQTQIIVSFLGSVRNYDSLLVRMRTSGVTYLSTSLSQTRQMILAIQEEKTLHPSSTDSLESGGDHAPPAVIPERSDASKIENKEVTRVG